MKTRYIEGVKINFGLTKDDFLSKVKKGIESRSGSDYICTVNPEFIIKAQKDGEFKKAINNSYLSIPDGAGVLMANKYLESIKNVSRNNILYPLIYFIKGVQIGIKSILKPSFLGERLAGSSLLYDMCEMSEDNNWNVSLLGGWEKDKLGRMRKDSGNIAQKASEVLEEKYPNLRIISATSEFSDKREDDEETVKYMKERMSQNNVSDVDLVFIAYSFGNQEKWLERNLSKIPAKLGIGIGGTFDQIAGTQRRSPKLFVNLHLEWLFRLITQPWRLKRVLTAFPYFPLRVFFSSLKQK